MSRENYGASLAPIEIKGETRLKGLAVSRGIAIGRITRLFGSNRQFYRIQLKRDAARAELLRFHRARDRAIRQLNRLLSSNPTKQGNSTAGILRTHLAILNDPSLTFEIETEISNQLINAEWAIKLVTDKHISILKTAADQKFRERYLDVEDIVERLLNALDGSGKKLSRMDSDSVVAAKELRPSTLAELAANGPVGLVTEHGGWTSHTFILARELGIPAVAGIRKAMRRLSNGDDVVIDGYIGVVILDPSRQTLEQYQSSAKDRQNTVTLDLTSKRGPTETLDGRQITIRANSDLPSVYRKAKNSGAEGIGLFRTEFLFNKHNGFPTEHQQFEAYRELAKIAGPAGTRIRTFDISVGNLIDHGVERENNPALGLRAIRLGLVMQSQLRTQLRALLRAAYEGRIDIVLPMVSGIGEIRIVKQILQSEKLRLEKKGIDHGSPGIGAMIEVPAAVLMIDSILKEVDFVSLGTNDLIQYLLAVDRDNESVADWFRTLHPAVIRAIRNVMEAAARASKPVIVCGEMAGSSFYIPLLIGLGATELSMNANSIIQARKMISGIAYEETRELAAEVLNCRTAEETESLVRTTIQKKWVHLFPAEFLR